MGIRSILVLRLNSVELRLNGDLRTVQHGNKCIVQSHGLLALHPLVLDLVDH